MSVKGNFKGFQSLVFLGQNRGKDVFLNVVKFLMTHISLSSLISFIVITVYPFFSLTNQSGNYLLPPTWMLSEGY